MHQNASTTSRASCPIGRMFDDIAPRYDLLNHVLSLGWDYLWRRRMVRCLPQQGSPKVVDLATGTGDVLISLLRAWPNIDEAVGLDISDNMLAICEMKLRKCGLQRAKLVQGDVSATPFASDSFDTATMAFGIRNAPDVAKTLKEMFRILKPDGTALIMEFSLPRVRIVRYGYLAYLRFMVPWVGALLSGNRPAYRYLNTSIEAFHGPERFCSLMEEAGFSNVSATPLTWGVASIYRGRKP